MKSKRAVEGTANTLYRIEREQDTPTPAISAFWSAALFKPQAPQGTAALPRPSVHCRPDRSLSFSPWQLRQRRWLGTFY